MCLLCGQTNVLYVRHSGGRVRGRRKEQSVTATEPAGEELPLAPGGREIGLGLEEMRSVSPSGQHTPEGGGMFQRQG